MLKLATVAQYLLPKNWHFKCQNTLFDVFTSIKNDGVKVFMKLTPDLDNFFVLTFRTFCSFRP